ncbi:MAG TPA: hypothetical protein VKU41_33200 [Polyangiaceae bacterium]|nr:hypothetical protein [Polyangiaceae bacterium]
MCLPIVSELGPPDAALDTLGGAYCIPGGVAFDPTACQTLCDPTAHPCQ